MAVSKSMTTLCLLLTLTSGLALPVSVGQNGGRKLLQTSPADILAALAANGGSPADFQTAIANVVRGSSTAQAAAALQLSLQAAKAAGNSDVLAKAVGDTSASQPGLSTAIGMVVATVVNPTNPNPSTMTGGNVTANLLVVSTMGTSEASIMASARAQAVAVDAIAVAVATAIATVDNGGPAMAAADACAQAIGTAIAIAVTNVTAKGTVGGNGVAIGTGVANAAAYAQAFSRATAAAFALARSGGSQASAFVLSEASTSAVASAVSSAEASINLQGPGTSSTSVMAVALSIRMAISTVIARAVALVVPATSG